MAKLVCKNLSVGYNGKPIIKNLNFELNCGDYMVIIGENGELDLTVLSSTMVYSEVFNMLTMPEEYVGKTVIIKGQFTSYEDPDTKIRYFGCIIADATACCSQGLEFVLAGNHSYPQDYPNEGDEITIKGTFEIQEEGEYKYIVIADAVMEN